MPNKFEVLGLKAQIRFIKHGEKHEGHLCGYVEIPKGHPYYRQGYDANGDWITASEDDNHRHQIKFPSIRVHGGVTFSGELDEDGVYYWGFDCGHWGDTLAKCDERFVKQQIYDMAKQVRHIEAEYTGRKG